MKNLIILFILIFPVMGSLYAKNYIHLKIEYLIINEYLLLFYSMLGI